MVQLDLVLIVDNNGSRIDSIKQNLQEYANIQTYKVAVNGEHALLCLDHIEMCLSMRDKRVVVIMNLETPVVDGIFFLERFKDKKYVSKDKIVLLALEDVSSPKTLEIALQKGIMATIESNLNFEPLVAAMDEFFSDKEKKDTKFRMPDRPKNLPITI